MFQDRDDAGQQLASAVRDVIETDTVIAALPRGGVPVAQHIAHAFGRPFSTILVRKLGVPGNEEFAFGAIAPGGVQVIDHETVDRIGLSPHAISEVIAREESELARRMARFPHLDAQAIADHPVLIVDDGIATGATALAAVRAAQAMGATSVTVAAPVASQQAVLALQHAGAHVVTLDIPQFFGAVGAFYADFTQVSDEDVITLLNS